MSSFGRHNDCVGARIRCNSKIRYKYKPVKKAKIRYIRYEKNPLYPDFPKSIFNRHGVFRSVRDLEVHKRMRSSDAKLTCCATMAVNTCFFSLREMPPSNMASRSPKTWYLTHYHVPIRLPKSAHLIMMASKFFLSSKMSKTGKNSKNPL